MAEVAERAGVSKSTVSLVLNNCPSAISWGVLLQEGQNLTSLALAPWVLTPGVFVVIAVLFFNFSGDGLRDTVAPYSR